MASMIRPPPICRARWVLHNTRPFSVICDEPQPRAMERRGVGIASTTRASLVRTGADVAHVSCFSVTRSQPPLSGLSDIAFDDYFVKVERIHDPTCSTSYVPDTDRRDLTIVPGGGVIVVGRPLVPQIQCRIRRVDGTASDGHRREVELSVAASFRREDDPVVGFAG